MAEAQLWAEGGLGARAKPEWELCSMEGKPMAHPGHAGRGSGNSGALGWSEAGAW